MKHNWHEEIDNIRNMGLQGMTLKSIGLHYNVTGQYIKKLIAKYNIFEDSDIYGASARAADKQKINKQRLRLKYGNKDNSALYRSQRKKFISKKSYAVMNNIEFTVNFGELTFPEYCPILCIKLDFFAKDKPNRHCPSFDRIDNTKGYVTGNVEVISHLANTMKNSATPEQLILFATYILNRYKPI